MPTTNPLLNKGNDLIRYTAKLTNNPSLTLPAASNEYRWVILDTGNYTSFYVVDANPTGGPLILNRVVFTDFKATCTLKESDLKLYANDVSAFFGDTSTARYGIKNSVRFVILTGLRDNFNQTLRNYILIGLLVCVGVVVIIAAILGVKILLETNKVLK